MTEEISKPFSGAWQPFTPAGVAAFATSSTVRVLVLKSLVALIGAIAVLWFLRANYVPSISEAVQNFPEQAALKNGALMNADSQILTQRKFLSAIIDVDQTNTVGQTADVQIELRKNNFQICSLFGCVPIEYPKEEISLGRSSSEPWWGARKPVILAMCAAGTFFGLLFTWAIFSCIYAPIAKLLAYFSDRELSWRGSWRLATAAQMPGALLMALAIVLYGVQAFDLIRFLFFFSLHFLVAWFFVFAAPFCLPRVSDTASPKAANPFH